MNKMMINPKPRRLYTAGLVSLVLAVAFSLTGGVALAKSPAATAPFLGTASSFAVLAGTAVTCTDSTVVGDVGVYPGKAVTQTNCTITGTVHAGDGVAKQAQKDFLAAYAKFADIPCNETLTGTLADKTLPPGVYCFDADATLTGTLTLDALGDQNAVWIFKVGTLNPGALTGTDFSVVMAGGGQLCNVYWWVDAGATMTTSNFVGTILAGAAITVTGGTFDGDALAKAAVTLTGATLTSCEAGGGKQHGSRCNQGVGNGPEGCDPGNSNHHNPSNDENGGVPGNPGRK